MSQKLKNGMFLPRMSKKQTDFYELKYTDIQNVSVYFITYYRDINNNTN